MPGVDLGRARLERHPAVARRAAPPRARSRLSAPAAALADDEQRLARGGRGASAASSASTSRVERLVLERRARAPPRATRGRSRRSASRDVARLAAMPRERPRRRSAGSASPSRRASSSASSSWSSATSPSHDDLAAAPGERAQVLQRRLAATPGRRAANTRVDEPVADVPVERAQQEDRRAARGRRRSAPSSSARPARRPSAAARAPRARPRRRSRRRRGQRQQRVVVALGERARRRAGTLVGEQRRGPALGLRQRPQGLERLLELASLQPGQLLVERPRGALRPARARPAGRTRSGACSASSGSEKPETIAGMPRSANAARIGSVPPVRTSAGSRPHGALDRAPRGLQRRRLGVERRRLGAVGAEDVSSAPSGSASRSSASRLRAISSERWPPTIRTDRSAEATGTTIVRAWPPSMRWTSSDGSAVVRT